VDLPERVELFLELYPANEPEQHPYAGYYLVDHDKQMIFWGAPSSTSDLGALRVNPDTFSNHHLSKLNALPTVSPIELFCRASNDSAILVSHSMLSVKQ
jgi:hypothetical protein